jgi:CBS domain-containing protein
MISLKSLMTSPVVTITPESVIADAVALMDHHGISALVIVDGQFPVGIFTERSLLRLIISGSFNPDQAISEVITPKLITAKSEIDIHEAYLPQRAISFTTLDWSILSHLMTLQMSRPKM